MIVVKADPIGRNRGILFLNWKRREKRREGEGRLK